MKVVVQNGAQHVLTRSEAEEIVGILPVPLCVGIQQLCLYHASDDEIRCEFYEKEKVLGLFASTSGDTSNRKESVVDELLVSLALISIHGYLPEKVSEVKRRQILGDLEDVRSQCVSTFDGISRT